MVIVVCSRKHLLLGVSVYVIAVFPSAHCGDSVYTYNYMYVYSESAHLVAIAVFVLWIASAQQGSSYKFDKF